MSIRYPNIIGKTDAQKLEQMKSYLHQLADELNYQLDRTGNLASGYPSTANEDAKAVMSAKKNDSISNFNDIKALIIKSADIVNAYYEYINKKLEGEYVAVSDFGTFKETTEAQLTASSAQVSSVLTKQEQIETDIGDMERELRSEIEQTADSIELEVTNGTPGKTASIKLTVGDDVYTGTIDMTGLVTFTNLRTKGQTVINGDNITTGTLDASLVNVVNLVADAIVAGKLLSVNGRASFDLDKGEFWVADENGTKLRLSNGYIVIADAEGQSRVSLSSGPNVVGGSVTSLAFNGKDGSRLFGVSVYDNNDSVHLALPNALDENAGAAISENPCWRRFGGIPIIAGDGVHSMLVDLTSEVKNALPIANGGTDATTAAAARQNINVIGLNPITSASNDSPVTWKAFGTGVAYFNKTGCITDQPTTNGLLQNYVYNNTVLQEWFVRGTAPRKLVRTGQASSGWNSSWIDVSIAGQTDYVTATGTSGAWRYWKFNSGLCIAMGQPTVAWIEPSQVVSGQTRSATVLDLSGIFTAVMGGTCSNVHRYVNCFVTTSGGASAELWATTAVARSTLNVSNFSTTPFVVLFGKWK